MNITQISVFLENKSGRLASVTQFLKEAGVNIRALSIADTSDFGILRLIVDKPEVAYDILKAQGFAVSKTDVIAVSVPDRVGGLAQVLQIFQENHINLEYLYAFIGHSKNDAITVCRVENPEKAVASLNKEGIVVLTGEEILGL